MKLKVKFSVESEIEKLGLNVEEVEHTTNYRIPNVNNEKLNVLLELGKLGYISHYVDNDIIFSKFKSKGRIKISDYIYDIQSILKVIGEADYNESQILNSNNEIKVRMNISKEIFNMNTLNQVNELVSKYHTNDAGDVTIILEKDGFILKSKSYVFYQ